MSSPSSCEASSTFVSRTRPGEAFKFEVTLENGAVYYDYVDTESYLELGTDATHELDGHRIIVETRFGDYREVDGVLFPHAIETGARDRPEHLSVVVDRVAINPDIDDERFKMPRAER